MNKKISVEQPVIFKRVNDSCMTFRLKKYSFISDNNFLFLASQHQFCPLCFQRRYISQIFDAVKVTTINENTLALAKDIDANFNNNNLWQAFIVNEKKHATSFEFHPYEDCPACKTQKTQSASDAEEKFEQIMTQSALPNVAAMKQQIFSFGFAKARSMSQQVGLNNTEYDKLLNNNYYARVMFKIVAASGNYSESSATGLAADAELAELKSLMEYLERYAFNMQVCRFKTSEFDEKIITTFLSLYKHTTSTKELKHIKHQAGWGINLATKKAQAIPLSFIYNKNQVNFIKPSSSGFGAHTDYSLSLCSSIIELVERDAFVRFWYEPQRAFSFKPDEKVQDELKSIISIMKPTLDGDELLSHCYVLQSATKLPVVLITISNGDTSKPPALCFGCGANFELDGAIKGALEELRLNVVNLIKAITIFKGFLTRQLPKKIESIPDRMGLYATSLPREKLKFLDNKNLLVDGIVEDEKQHGLDALVNRFSKINFEIYGIDCTPQCFQDKNVFVTRAFSPQLYPIQFEQENVFNLEKGPLSAQSELPHFFI